MIPVVEWRSHSYQLSLADNQNRTIVNCCIHPVTFQRGNRENIICFVLHTIFTVRVR